MAYTADAVANYLLDKAQAAEQQLTQMKLQKLVYFAHGWHLAINDQPLINESVQAWRYGPVIYSLYREFREYKNNPITRRAREAVWDGTKIGIETPNIAGVGTEPVRGLLDRTWEVYSPYTAVQLSNYTHAVGSPWHTVASAFDGQQIPLGLTIPDALIRDYFRARAAA